MTAPGGDHDEARPSRSGAEGPHQPPWAPPPAADYPPPAYQPPGYSPGYQAGYPPGYPPNPSPPGYEQPPPYPPPGYGPPPYPGAYYPTPDYAGGYGAQASGTNGLAIASLVASFAGVLCCVGSIAAIVMGAIALDQIKRNRQEGYGLAVAGIVIGIATLVVNIVVVTLAMRSH